MLILAIDPGPEQSGYIVYRATGSHDLLGSGKWLDGHTVVEAGVWPNADLLIQCGTMRHHTLVIEEIQHYGSGMPAGKSTFDTKEIMGQFFQAWHPGELSHPSAHKIARPTIKAQLCASARAKDANVRQALIDRFPATGRTTKGEPSSIGTKKHPGPLYGITGHMWSALAVAVAWAERHEQEKGE